MASSPSKRKPQVGQVVVALRDLWHPELGEFVHTGDTGEITGVGVDAAYGWVQVRWEGMALGTGYLTSVEPWAAWDPMARLAGPLT